MLRLQSIYHRDLRMENLLLDGNYFESTLKISNFGYSKSSVLDSMAKTAAVGAPAYTPPELLLLAARSDGSAYDGAAIDVWASGIILYCLLTGKLPFLVCPAPSCCTLTGIDWDAVAVLKSLGATWCSGPASGVCMSSEFSMPCGIMLGSSP